MEALEGEKGFISGERIPGLEGWVEKILVSEFQVMYFISLEEGKATFIHGDEEAKKFMPIFNANTAEGMLDNFHKFYVDALVVDEDKERVKSVMNAPNMYKVLKDRSSMSVTFRVRRNLVDAVYTEMRIFNAGEKDGKLAAVILAFRMADDEMSKALRLNEKLQHEIMDEMLGDEGVFLINCEKDTRSTIHNHGHGAEEFTDTEKFSVSFRRYVDTLVVETDREKMAKYASPEYLMDCLKEEKEFKVIYRDMSQGMQRFYEMRVARFSDTEVLQSFADKDREIADRLISNKLKDEYFALIGVDLDSGCLQVLKRSPWYEMQQEGEILDYTPAMKTFASTLKGEPKELFERISSIDYLKRRFAKDDKSTHTYKSYKLKGNKWVQVSEIVLMRHTDGSPSILAIGFSLLDEDASEKEEMQRLQREAYESQKLIDSIISSYNIAYLVNMKEDTLKVLSMDDNMLESKEEFDSFSQVRDFFIAELAHPRDKERMRKEMMFDTIRKRLAETAAYDVEYTVLKYGVPLGGEMRVTSIDENEIVIGMSDIDEPLLLRHLQKKRYDDYFCLYVVDIDTETVKVMKASPWYDAGEIGKALPYKQTLQAFASTLDDEPRAVFMKLSDIEYVKAKLAHEDKHAYSYKSKNVDGGKWVNVISFVTIRKEDGTPAEFTFGFSYADSIDSSTKDMQEQLKEDMEMIGGMASGYNTLYYVNIAEKVFKVYALDEEKSPELKKYVNENIDPFEQLRAFGQSELIHPDDRNQFANLNATVFRERLAHAKKFSIRFRRNYSGTYKWMEMDAIKYENVDEMANAIVVGFSDRDTEIRHEQKMQKQLESAYKAAEVANKSKTSFLFNMSHDIRTPMNAITGFTSMAKKYIDDKEKVADYLNKIDLSGQQLLMLINQVLEMARIESGKIEFNETPVDIKESYEALVTILAEQAKGKGLEFHYTMKNVKHFKVIADDARMSQITINIVGNAIKYTPEGGSIDFILKENACKREGYASYTFTLADTGIGMSEEYLKNLYEPFTREKSTTVSKIQGTGLGLSIVKSLVDLMGGKIEVESALGKGTRFDITVELKIDDRAKADSQQSKNSSLFTKETFKGHRVLLVEDNELNREIARFMLEDMGLEVDEADDGHIAVEKVIEANKKGNIGYYDMILMDIQMPTMDGYEATRAIRELERSNAAHVVNGRIHNSQCIIHNGAQRTAHVENVENVGNAENSFAVDRRPLTVDDGNHIPIIALSANAFEEDKQRSRDAGMDDHIAKPINIEQLRDALKKFLN